MHQLTAAAIAMKKKHCLHGAMLTAAARGRHKSAHQSKVHRNQDLEDGTQRFNADQQKMWPL